jgi:hypothetical protein
MATVFTCWPSGQNEGVSCASGIEWYSLSEPCAVVDAAGRDRLESTSTDCRTSDGRMSVSSVSMRLFFF